MNERARLALCALALTLAACPDNPDFETVTPVCAVDTIRLGCGCAGAWTVGSTVRFRLDPNRSRACQPGTTDPAVCHLPKGVTYDLLGSGAWRLVAGDDEGFTVEATDIGTATLRVSAGTAFPATISLLAGEPYKTLTDWVLPDRYGVAITQATTLKTRALVPGAIAFLRYRFVDFSAETICNDRPTTAMLGPGLLLLRADSGTHDCPIVTPTTELLEPGREVWIQAQAGAPPGPTSFTVSYRGTTVDVPVDLLDPAAITDVQLTRPEPLLLEARAFAGTRAVTTPMRFESLTPDVVRFYDRCPGWSGETAITTQGPFVILTRVAAGEARVRVTVPGAPGTPKEISWQQP